MTNQLDEAREIDSTGREIFRPTIHNVEGGFAFQVRIQLGPETFVDVELYEAVNGRNHLRAEFRQYAPYVPGQGARTEQAADLTVYDVEYARP